jgi:hypothetical protein
VQPPLDAPGKVESGISDPYGHQLRKYRIFYETFSYAKVPDFVSRPGNEPLKNP